MRSPIIAFSLFVAVSPSLISAAPASPKLNGDSLTHARNTDLKLPQRFAVPRQLDDVMGSLPLGGQPSSPSGSNQGYKPGQPLPGDNTSPSSAQNHDPTGLTSKLNGDTPADKAAGTVSDPAAAIEEHHAPTEPTPPNGAGRSPELSTGNTLPNGDAHNGAVPATSRPLGEAPGKTGKDEATAGNIVS